MKKWMWIILFCLLTTGAYLNSIGNEFAWDDEYLIVKNSSIKNLKNIPLFFLQKDTQIVSPGMKMKWYRPILTSVYSIEYQLFGLNPRGYHITNLLFHLCNVIIIYFGISYLFSHTHGVLSALLFSVHPLLTEAVSYLTGMADLMCAFFFLAALFLYTCFPKKRFYLFLFCLSFLFSLLSKEMGITLPLIVLVFCNLFKGRDGIAKKSLHYLSGCGIVIVIFTALRLISVGDINKGDYYGGNFLSNMYMTVKIFVIYIKLLLFPINQSARYDVPFSYSIFDSEVMAALIFLSLLFTIIVMSCKHSKIFAFGMIWFFVTLLPVSNFIFPLVGSMMGERFLYLPSIGFFLACSDVMIKSYHLLSNKFSYLHLRRCAHYLLLIIIIAYSALTINRNFVWADNLTLFRDTARKFPDSLVVRLNLVSEYEKLGRYDLAEAEYEKAKRINLLNVNLHIQWGQIHLKNNMINKAIEEFEKAVKTNPRHPHAHAELAKAYEKIGETGSALTEWRKAARLDPGNREAMTALDRLKAR